jgi:hypothetical protein
VTEAEWLACTDPEKMLEYLRGKSSDRKVRLFGVACCRCVWHLLTDNRSRKAVEVAERYADGAVSPAQMDRVNRAASPVEHDIPTHNPFAAHAANLSSWPNGQVDSIRIADMAVVAVKRHLSITRRKAVGRLQQGRSIRCIFGNPFRPVSISPAWRTPVVQGLAQAAYEQRELPAGTLDTSRLAVLADALEEAGCTDADLLNHLRGPGPHVRGCWAVDLILGKG